MGREWYWSSNKSKRGEREKGNAAATTTTTTPSGCMSAVFHLFDFHHFQFPLHHHHQHHPSSFKIPEDHHNILKGVEAPRNSLELEETDPLPLSLSTSKEQESLKIPMGIQIKTKVVAAAAPNDSSSSEISSSPAKTPNLVARLMGLDLLPDCHSPSSSSTLSFQETPTTTKASNLHHHLPRRQQQPHHIIKHRNSIDGTRSLPDTPRISSARRSDVDYHHRLSLQINKENEDIEFSRFSYLRRKELKQEDEYRSSSSPSHYARQIVKQVKESVSRKVGLHDITNTGSGSRNRELQTREELVSQLKAKKSSRALTKLVENNSGPCKQHSSPNSCSPRLSRFLDPKNKPSSSINIQPQPQQQQPIKVLTSKPKLQPLQEQEQEQRPAKKCKKVVNVNQKLKKPPQTTDIIRNKQEEPFVRPSTVNRVNSPDHKKTKKTPLSNDLLNIAVPSLVSVKKDPSPPPPTTTTTTTTTTTKLPQKQVMNVHSSKRVSQLSSKSSQTYKQEATHTLTTQDKKIDRSNGATVTTTTTTTRVSPHQFEYVTRILKRTGIDNHTLVSFTSWFSPSHPLDPSIFHHLENNTTSSGELSYRCNRKLLFDLVDEVLVQILKPFINIKPWVNGGNGRHMQGSELIEKLCVIITSFPCADCKVLEDIDALIDKDLPEMKVQQVMVFEEEGEGVVMEIEKDVLDTLIHEMALDFLK